MTTFEMLQELLAQNEFELLLPEDHTANTTEQDIRLVYQMNDTVESFLVFRKAIFTGTYKKDYEGKLDASYDRDQDRYVLGVRQGDSVITLFYQKLELEVNLYNYGEIAHFWVPRYENLRQLEFRIAVLWDKYTYLGENYCSEGEKRLVHLADVPALNFCSYCAAPEPYMVPHEMPKGSFLQGLDVMEQLAKQAKDWLLVGWIRFYRRHPSTIVTRWVAHVLHHSIHFGFVKTLTETIKRDAHLSATPVWKKRRGTAGTVPEKSKRTEGRTGKDGRICRNCAAGAIYNCKRSAGFKGVSAGQPPGDGKPEDSGGGNRIVILLLQFAG